MLYETKVALFLLALPISGTSAVAAPTADPCQTVIERLLKDAPTSAVWNDLKDIQKNYSRCMDGIFAENIETVVTRALADRWTDLTQQKTFFDDDFIDFLAKNIDEEVTASETQVGQIKSLAATKCPDGMTSSCEKLRKAALRAEAEESEADGQLLGSTYHWSYDVFDRSGKSTTAPLTGKASKGVSISSAWKCTISAATMTTKTDEARSITCSHGAERIATLVWCRHNQVAQPGILEISNAQNRFLGKVQLYCTDHP